MFFQSVNERLAKHIRELRSCGYVPAVWHWDRKKIRSLENIDKELIDDLVAFHERVGGQGFYDVVKPMAEALRRDLEHMLKTHPEISEQNREAAIVNDLIQQLGMVRVPEPKGKHGKLFRQIYEGFLDSEGKVIIHESRDEAFHAFFTYLDTVFTRVEENEVMAGADAAKGVRFRPVVRSFIAGTPLHLDSKGDSQANAVKIHWLHDAWKHSLGQNFLFVICFSRSDIKTFGNAVGDGYAKDHLKHIGAASAVTAAQFGTQGVLRIDGLLYPDTIRFIGFRYPVDDEDFLDVEGTRFNFRYYRL